MARLQKMMVMRPRPWRESRLISRDGTLVYVVRDRDGEERQVLQLSNKWVPISKAQFSILPCFEEYHRDLFNTAVPYDGGRNENTTPSAGEGRQ